MPRKRGFTLIELLLTLFVLGIVMTIAVSTYRKMRERAIVAAASADLRNVATAQELYYQTHDFTYAKDVETLTQAGFFRPSPGISVEITAASEEGWEASATNVAAGVSCQVTSVQSAIQCAYDGLSEDREIEGSDGGVILAGPGSNADGDPDP